MADHGVPRAQQAAEGGRGGVPGAEEGGSHGEGSAALHSTDDRAQTSTRHVTLTAAILEAQNYWNVSCWVVGSSFFRSFAINL